MYTDLGNSLDTVLLDKPDKHYSGTDYHTQCQMPSGIYHSTKLTKDERISTTDLTNIVILVVYEDSYVKR